MAVIISSKLIENAGRVVLECEWYSPVIENTAALAVLTADDEHARAKRQLQVRCEPAYEAAVVESVGEVERE